LFVFFVIQYGVIAALGPILGAYFSFYGAPASTISWMLLLSVILGAVGTVSVNFIRTKTGSNRCILLLLSFGLTFWLLNPIAAYYENVKCMMALVMVASFCSFSSISVGFSLTTELTYPV
jgi:carbon starvation protein CstA